jgi:hypothetical protein
VHPDRSTGQIELHDYAERNGLVPAWEYTRAFAKWQSLLSPEQYAIVEVRTSRGVSRAMLFPKAIRAELEANAPSTAKRWQSSVSDCGRETPSKSLQSFGFEEEQCEVGHTDTSALPCYEGG